MKTMDLALESRAATLWTLGRRVERLLLCGIALIALAMLAFFLATAARHYAENRASQGMESLALMIEGDDKVLQRFYDLEAQRQKLVQQKKTGKEKDKARDKEKEAAPAENFYEKALEDKVAQAAALSGSDAATLRPLVSAALPPAELVKSLRERKKATDDSPATVAGMAVPSSSLATGLPAAFIANVLVVGLAPLIILWLGALWTTRRRERDAIDGEGGAYPHALNASGLPLETIVFGYALQRWPAIDWYHVRALLLACQRMALTALLVVPVVAAYIATVITLGTGADTSALRTLYLVAVIAVMVAQVAGVVVSEAAELLRSE